MATTLPTPSLKSGPWSRRTTGGSIGRNPNNPGVSDALADPHNPRERVLILAQGGPLLVEFSMTIDEQPFRMAREKVVEQMMQVISADDGAKPTWEAALANSRFSARLRGLNEAGRKSYAKQVDTNQNGQVERGELYGFLARLGGGSAFTFSPGYQSAGTSDLRKLLDTNKDGELAAEEIAQAGARLKSRDANDDDWIDAGELGAAAGRSAMYTLTRRMASSASGKALYLGPGTSLPTLKRELERHYGDRDGKITSERFGAASKLFERLDRDTDGELQTRELAALADAVAPQLKLAVAFREGGGKLALNELAPPLARQEEDGAVATVNAPGCRLRFETNASSAGRMNYEAQAKSYMQRFDSDKNGYLEAKEVSAGNLLKTWDVNGDGKVYPDEIMEYFRQIYLPMMTQVRLLVSIGADPLFEALDANGDGRLSLRESRQAQAAIKKLDLNSDGRVGEQEIPETISVSVSQGTGGYGYGRLSVNRGTYSGVGTSSPASAGPRWFVHMDRNGDGDITLREFLGEESQFKKLDRNRDGFIDAKEAASDPAE